jgi:hypothetical protein
VRHWPSEAISSVQLADKLIAALHGHLKPAGT